MENDIVVIELLLRASNNNVARRLRQQKHIDVIPYPKFPN